MAAVSPVAAAVECKQTKKPGLASFEGTGGSAFDGKYNKNNNDFCEEWNNGTKEVKTGDRLRQGTKRLPGYHQTFT
ncbi:hypothetical protein FOIG_16680 [Fusarium odoratissimum NRRL 54006]|uniref:Uncharacterized protein n=1 Tax=Fusarium odoratissimum (strain NRRL 54006) TaxID=1089451 RepID=X0J104_FUSO5|nr:uncharacterized protein FOIG_16680 [Fusarium odoratissimum NRRL 54006]EXL90056.1 hypothetical protein FOIG_16680 [Fusarium odoratissimum NRRL 54006]